LGQHGTQGGGAAVCAGAQWRSQKLQHPELPRRSAAHPIHPSFLPGMSYLLTKKLANRCGDSRIF
jgi:hypothetical protein